MTAMTSTAQPRSTLYRVADDLLGDQGTSLEVLILDGIDEGKSYDDLTFEIRERTKVPVSSRTVRRWAESVSKAAS